MLSFWKKYAMMSRLSQNSCQSTKLRIYLGKNGDQVRLDISARGLWEPFQKTMDDVRIFHPNADSYKNRELKAVYLHEKEKCKSYEQRVVQVEKCSFVPLIYSTMGGMSPRTLVFHQRIGKLVAEKEKKCIVMS